VDLHRIYHEAHLEHEYMVPLIVQPPYVPDLLSSYLMAPWTPAGQRQPIFNPQFFEGYLGDITGAHLRGPNMTIVTKVKTFDLQYGQLGPKHRTSV
jgi:hypothetical protein